MSKWSGASAEKALVVEKMKLQKLAVVGLVIHATQAACPNNCNGNGECGEGAVCECNPYYTGADCSLRQCPFGLSWQTETADTLAGLATPNYPSGIHAYAECSDRGLCDTETGRCICFIGYEGYNCGRSSCPENCNGHGQCVLDAEVDATNYFNEGLLMYQKQYWNAYKTQQCVCDRGWWGTDCSLRLCPEGEAQTGCDADEYLNDIHMVTLTFNDLENTPAGDIEQFFTLTFTDMFHGKFTTKPISFWDDVAVTQQALNSLPNFVIQDAEVNKISPLYDETQHDPPICTTSYNSYFQDVGCEMDANCTSKFPGAAGVNPAFAVFCDAERGKCVETATADACVYIDGRTEFDNGCGTSFQVDGMYLDSAGRRIWGRETTAAEKACHLGPFGDSETFYAKACEDEQSCASCSSMSGITAGSCSTTTSQCAPTSEWNEFIDDVTTNNCHVVSFLVKFVSTATPGMQELLECNVGSTDFSGAFPRYPSSSLSCDVQRVSNNQWVASDVDQVLCFAAGTDGYEGSFVDNDDATALAACESTFTIEELQTKSEAESYRWSVTDSEGVVFTHSLAGIFDSTEVNSVVDFTIATPCSSQGDCNVATGECTCGTGFHGAACEFPDVDLFV